MKNWKNRMVMDERHELLIMNYINDTLSEEEMKEWEGLVSAGTIDLDEVENYRKMLIDMDRIETPEPSEAMSQGFYSMLGEQIQQSRKVTVLDNLATFFMEMGLSKTSLQMAYSLVVLIVGLGAGYLLIGKEDKGEIAVLSSEVQEMKSMMMMSLLEKESPSERIKAVSLTQDMESVDDEVIDALFTTLNNDNNTNVRLKSLDALVRYADLPEVRIGLIESLEGQENPLVQMALADVMVLLQDNNAREALQKMLDKDEVMDDVKEVINERLKTMNS